MTFQDTHEDENRLTIYIANYEYLITKFFWKSYEHFFEISYDSNMKPIFLNLLDQLPDFR